MLVKEILAKKGRDVFSLSQENSLGDALSLLHERGVGALVVTGSRSPFVGIFSERDAVRALAASGPDALAMHIADFMTTDVNTCDEETHIDALMALMTEKRIRHVPVVHHGELLGMVSIGDVVKWRVDELETDKRELLEYVSAR